MSQGRFFQQPSKTNKSATRVLSVLLVGEPGVGKFSLATRQSYNIFPIKSEKAINDVGTFDSCRPACDHTFLKLTVCHQFRDDFLETHTHQRFDLVFCVYDLSYEGTLKDVLTWQKRRKQLLTEAGQLVLVGNKSDKNAVFTQERIDRLEGFDAKFEVSAKAGTNVNEMFEQAAMHFLAEEQRLEELPPKKSGCTIL